MARGCPGRWGDRASEEFLARQPTPARTPSWSQPRRLRRQRRGRVRTLDPGPGRLDADEIVALPPAHVEDTPDTPTIASPWSSRGQRAQVPRADRLDVDRRRHPQERRVDGDRTRWAPREPLVIGLPGDREVDLKRLVAAQLEPRPRSRCSRPPSSPAYPDAGPRLHRPDRVLGAELRQRASAIWSTRSWSAQARRWVTGGERQRPARLRPGLPGATSPCPARTGATAPSRPPTIREGDPAPDGSGPLHGWPGGSRWATSSQLGPLVRRRAGAARCSTPNGKLVTVTMGSYGSRDRLSRSGGGGGEHLRRQGRPASGRERAGSVRRAPGRWRARTPTPPARPPMTLCHPPGRGRGRQCCYDDRARASPGGEVRRRRNPRDAHHRGGRPRATPTGVDRAPGAAQW